MASKAITPGLKFGVSLRPSRLSGLPIGPNRKPMFQAPRLAGRIPTDKVRKWPSKIGSKPFQPKGELCGGR